MENSTCRNCVHYYSFDICFEVNEKPSEHGFCSINCPIEKIVNESDTCENFEADGTN